MIIWGTFSIPLRHIKTYSSEQILSYRTFISLLITWGITLLFRRKYIHADLAYLKTESTIKRKKTLLLVLLAGFLLGVNWLSFIYAINHISLKSGAFAYMICPLITAMGGFLILKESLSKFKLIAIGIASISIWISSLGSFEEVFWSIIIASSFAFYLITQRVLIKLDKLNLLGAQLFIISLLILPSFLHQTQLIPTELHFWTTIVGISVVFTVIPLLLSSYALIGVPSSTFGIMIYINPIIAFIVAFAYFDEGIKKDQLYSYTLLLIAVIVFNWDVISTIFGNQKAKEPDTSASIDNTKITNPY